MLNSLKHTLTSTVHSVSGFVGGVSNAAAPAAQNTNDAAEPDRTRTLHPPRSPATTSRRVPLAIDLTSPSRREAHAFSPRLKHTTNLHTSNGAHDSRTDVGSASERSGGSKAEPLPDPRFHFARKTGMPKPGANHAHQPKNTLTQQTYHPSSGVHKTYGQSSRRDDYTDFLDEQQFDTRATKKRRTANESTDAISVYDEGDTEEIRPGDQTPRPVSRRSAGSGSLTLPGVKHPRSEFGKTSAVVDSRRKKARNSTSNGNSGFINGGAQPAILIDDDHVPDSGANPRKLQLQNFQQGVERPRDRASGQQVHDTTSKYFAPKMNHSTLPLDASTQRAARRSNNLRDGFSRGPLSNASARDRWPIRWIRAHDFKETREGLFLDSRVLNEYRITSSDRNDVKYEIRFKDVRSAYTDHQSRIRMTGSTNTANNLQYLVDLEFEDKQNLDTFAQAMSNSITAKHVHPRSEDYMIKIFQKPLAVTTQPLNIAPPVDGQNQVQQVSNVTKPRLLNNLARASGVTGSKSSATAPFRTETGRLSERPVRTTRASKPPTIDLGDFEDLPEVERFSEIHGLGPPWKKPLNYNSGRRRAVVDFKDLERLDDGQFLNDQLIDFYLLYLFDQAKVPRDKVYLFNTHFFTTLSRKVPGQRGLINYQGVARWTAKEDIFGYDYIVVPINQDIHWYLAIICNVTNIARTPAIQDLTKNEGVGPEASKELDNEPPGHEAKMGDIPSIPLPALVDPPSESSPSYPAIEVVDPDDSDLNVVDPSATGPDHGVFAPSGSSSIAESPAAETAQMKKLTLSDSKPEGILLGSSSTAEPKKPKRRLGPPPKKQDVNKPVIVVLDSLGGSAKSPAVRVLKEYILAEGEEKRGMNATIPGNAFYAKENQIPQQQNYVDCGVYLLGYAQQFFEDPDLFKNRLLSGEMQIETDWPDMTMSSMRAGMRDILQRLNREQEAEREQAKKQKKQEKKASPDATVDVEQKATVAKEAETSTLTVDEMEATPTPEATEEKPSILSNIQPYPRLSSPFQPRSTQKRDRSHSKSVPAPTQTNVVLNTKGQEAPTSDGQKASPTIHVPHRSRSPVVSIPPPARKSPKRPREAILVGDSPEETIKKKVRTDLKSPKDFMEGGPRIVGIRSPAQKAAILPKRRERASTPRVASLPARGSSGDPIQLDESQELPMSTNGAPQDTKRNSGGADFTIRSPTSGKGTRLPPTRQCQPHMSSPTRSNIQRGSLMRRRETRSANESPDPIVDLDDLDDHEAPLQRMQSHSSRSNRSKWRLKTPDEEMPEKTIEVPETPPHDG